MLTRSACPVSPCALCSQPNVQIVACAVCTLLTMGGNKRKAESPPAAPTGSGSSPTAGSPTAGSLPPLSPRGRQTDVPLLPPPLVPSSQPTLQQPTARLSNRTKGSPIINWEAAQKRLGQKDFKASLLSFDARRLLDAEAAEVERAVRERIAVADLEGVEVGSSRGSKKGGGSGSKKSWRAAASAAASAAVSADSGAGFASSQRSSLATVAARARRASYTTAEDVLSLGPLKLQDAAYGNQTIGALFLWCSRVLANVDALRAAEEEQQASHAAAQRERDALAAEVRAAEARLSALEAALRAAEEEGRRRAEEQAAREREQAAREREQAEAERRRRAEAEAANEARRQAESAEMTRRAEMKRAEEEALLQAEREAASRSSKGERAVLEVVDVVIKQKVEFKAGSTIGELTRRVAGGGTRDRQSDGQTVHTRIRSWVAPCACVSPC